MLLKVKKPLIVFCLFFLFGFSFLSWGVANEIFGSDRQNEGKAIDLVGLRKAVAYNDPQAKAYIPAVLAAECVNVPSDEAFLRQTAENGDADAQSEIGYQYANEGNIAEAIKWFRKSAKQGNPYSQNIIGRAYVADLGGVGPYGRSRDMDIAKNAGFSVSYVEAAKWFRRAAKQGNKDSAYFLGLLLRDGLGVKQNFEEAYFWLGIGVYGYHSKYVGVVEGLEKHLTPDQIAATVIRIKKWTPSYASPKRTKPKMNTKGLICGTSKKTFCQAADICGDIVGIDCNSGVDGAYHFVDIKTGELIGGCSFWTGACKPPSKWNCGRPKHYQ